MNKRGLSFLASLFLLTIIGWPATQSQANNAAKKSDESATSSGQDARPQKIRDEAFGKERNGEEWFNRGYELHSSDRYPEAIQAFKHSIDLGYRKATAMYNIACGYALLNDKENAFIWLERALANGFGRADLLRSDSDLDSLRSDARFKKILDSNPKATEKKNAYKTPDRLEQANLDFARLTRDASQDGSEWHKVGRRLLGLRDLDRSIVALNQAVALLDYKGSTAMYNLACAYALKGERDAGLNWLEKSINAGFDNNEKVKHDPDINSLRADARFKRIEKLSRTLSLSQFYGDSFDGSPYSKEQWAPAVALYEWFVQTEPYNGRAWFNLGYALHYSREHARAIDAFEHARQLGYNKPTSIYNIACAYAMLDQRELAFEWLDRAIDAGFDLHGSINGDRDLDNLRPDPRFERFLKTTWYERKDEKTDQ